MFDVTVYKYTCQKGQQKMVYERVVNGKVCRFGHSYASRI